MKKVIVLVLAMAMSATAALAGNTPGSGIAGSAHDMNMFDGISDSQGRVCAFCHTPHHADVISEDYMPLWSRELSAEPTFTQYDSETLDADNTGDFMRGPSILCMSCHDGTVAPDAYYGSAGTSELAQGDNYNEFGVGLAGDMSNDHPIGFDYTAVAGGTNWGATDGDADPEIFDEQASLVDRTDITGSNYGIAKIADVLWDDTNGGIGGGSIFTCASCHDVHNGPTVVENYFLYGPQQDSQFCRMCHLK